MEGIKNLFNKCKELLGASSSAGCWKLNIKHLKKFILSS